MKRISLLLILASITCLSTKAQDDIHGDPEVWFLLLNHYEINEKWTVGNEIHIRRTNWLSDQKQFILRPFVNFKPGESVIYTAGYSYISTEPYGEYPLLATLAEHNFWEQVTVNQLLGNLAVFYVNDKSDEFYCAHNRTFLRRTYARLLRLAGALMNMPLLSLKSC